MADIAVDLPDNIVEELDIPPPANAEPTMEEIEQYAEYMGLDLQDDEDRQYIWLLREGLKAPMPADWKKYRMLDTNDSFYFNGRTGESVWDHPCDIYYKELLQKEKEKVKKKKEEEKKRNAMGKTTTKTAKTEKHKSGLSRTGPGLSSLQTTSPLGSKPKLGASSPLKTNNEPSALDKKKATLAMAGDNQSHAKKLAIHTSSPDALLSLGRHSEEIGDLELDLNSDDDSDPVTPLSSRVLHTHKNSLTPSSTSAYKPITGLGTGSGAGSRPSSSGALGAVSPGGRLGMSEYKEEMERMKLKKESQDRLEKEKQRILKLQMEEKNEFIEEQEEEFEMWKAKQVKETQKKKKQMEEDHKKEVKALFLKQQEEKDQLKEALDIIKAKNKEKIREMDEESKKEMEEKKRQSQESIHAMELKLQVEENTLKQKLEKAQERSSQESIKWDEEMENKRTGFSTKKGEELKDLEEKYAKLFESAKKKHDLEMEQLEKEKREMEERLDEIRKQKDEEERKWLERKSEILREESSAMESSNDTKRKLERDIEALKQKKKDIEDAIELAEHKAAAQSRDSGKDRQKDRESAASASENLREALKRESDLRSQLEQVKRELSNELGEEKRKSSQLRTRLSDLEHSALSSKDHEKRRIRELEQQMKDMRSSNDDLLKVERQRYAKLNDEYMNAEEDARKKMKQYKADVVALEEEIESMKRQRIQSMSTNQGNQEAERQAEIDSLSQQVSQLRSQARHDKSKIEELEFELQNGGSVRAKQNLQQKRLEENIEELEQEVEKKNKKIRQLEKEKTDLREEMAKKEDTLASVRRENRKLEDELEKRHLGEEVRKGLGLDDSVDDMTEITEGGGPHAHIHGGASSPSPFFGMASPAGLGPQAMSYGTGMMNGGESTGVQRDIINQVRHHMKKQKALLFNIQKKLKQEVSKWKKEMREAKREHEKAIGRVETEDERNVLLDAFRERLEEYFLPAKTKLDQEIAALNTDIRKVREMRQWVERGEAVLAMSRVGMSPMGMVPQPQPSFMMSAAQPSFAHQTLPPQVSFSNTMPSPYRGTPSDSFQVYGGPGSGPGTRGGGIDYGSLPMEGHTSFGSSGMRSMNNTSMGGFGTSGASGLGSSNHPISSDDALARVEGMRNMLLKWCKTREDFSSSIQKHIGNLQSFSHKLTEASHAIRTPTRVSSHPPTTTYIPPNSPIDATPSRFDSSTPYTSHNIASPNEVVVRIKVDQ